MIFAKYIFQILNKVSSKIRYNDILIKWISEYFNYIVLFDSHIGRDILKYKNNVVYI